MLTRHVKRQLSAYCNGETGADESRRIERHLSLCPACRAEYREIQEAVRLAGHLKQVEVPGEFAFESVWSKVEDPSHARPPFKRHSRAGFLGAFTGSWRGLALAGLCLLIVAAGTVVLRNRRAQNPTDPQAWTVNRLAGSPVVGSSQAASGSRLGVGQWIETDAKSRATLKQEKIGEVDVEPESRLRLVTSSQNEYRLSLERGEVRARILAPPRIFIVDTPSAVAVDLGCAYTLHVDDSGAGKIEVTAGMVEFVSNGKKSVIPTDAVCLTRPGMGTGTPFFADASQELKDALVEVDFPEAASDRRTRAMETVLAQSRKKDGLTLWNLLSHVNGSERKQVYERLATLIPPPAGVTQAGIMNLDPKMLESWFLEVQLAWYE